MKTKNDSGRFIYIRVITKLPNPEQSYHQFIISLKPDMFMTHAN